MIRDFSLRKLAAGAALGCAVAGQLLVPHSAQAAWVRGVWVWRPRVVAVAPPVVVAPPPVLVVHPRPHWIPGHYTWRGIWVPGHWA